MNGWLPVKRATILLPSGPDQDLDRKHLFIVLTNPAANDGRVLIVPVNTVEEGVAHDSACYLYYQDHPFIQHKSFLKYRFCQLRSAAKLCAGANANLFVPQEQLNEQIFERVCHGLVTSKHTPPYMNTFYCNAD